MVLLSPAGRVPVIGIYVLVGVPVVKHIFVVFHRLQIRVLLQVANDRRFKLGKNQVVGFVVLNAPNRCNQAGCLCVALRGEVPGCRVAGLAPVAYPNVVAVVVVPVGDPVEGPDYLAGHRRRFPGSRYQFLK